MTVPNTVSFYVKLDGGIVQGVQLSDHTPYGEATLTESPMDAVELYLERQRNDGHRRVYAVAEVPNRQFEAIVKFDVHNKRGVLVQRIDMAAWYPMLPVDLIDLLKRGQIINGHVRGVWEVEKRQGGMSLKLVEPLPFASFNDDESN